MLIYFLTYIVICFTRCSIWNEMIILQIFISSLHNRSSSTVIQLFSGVPVCQYHLDAFFTKGTYLVLYMCSSIPFFWRWSLVNRLNDSKECLHVPTTRPAFMYWLNSVDDSNCTASFISFVVDFWFIYTKVQVLFHMYKFSKLKIVKKLWKRKSKYRRQWWEREHRYRWWARITEWGKNFSRISPL